MSNLVKREDFTDMVELWYTEDERIGTFQKLECDIHGTEWSFTDKSGADNCLECVKEMCEPEAEYTIPDFLNLEDSLEKLAIRKSTPTPTKSGVLENSDE